jgi:hypothetical protein
MLTTLPETDENVPVVGGVRLNTKKSPGKLGVKRRKAEVALTNATPTKVDVGVTSSPITDPLGLKPAVAKLSDVT